MDGLAGVGALLAGGGLAGVELLFRPKWLIVRQLLRAWGTRLLVVGVLFGVVLLVLPAAVAELRAELAGTGVLARTVRWVLDHTGQPAATTASGKTRLSEALALLNTLGIGTALLGVLRAVLRREQSRLVTLAAWVAVPLALTSGFLLLVNDASAVGATGGGWRRLGVAAVLLALLEAFGNLTNWSMHPFYKRRLSSAFMLHRPADGKAEPISYERRTHFRRELSKRGPQLVVCAAANVSDVGVTPPGRSALSFTFTREAIGCPTASIPTEALDTRFGKRAATSRWPRRSRCQGPPSRRLWAR